MGKRLLACVMAVVLAFPPYAVPSVALAEDEPSDLVIEQVDSSDEQASVDLDVQESLTDSSEVVDSPTEDAVVEDEQNESPSEAQNEPGDTEEASGASPAELGTAEGEEESEPTANVPDDATYWCGHYYKVYDAIGITPAAARAACTEKGGYLVTYTSVAERRYLTDLLNSSTPYSSIDGGAHYIINSVADIGDNNRQWATGEVFKYEEGFLNVRFIGEGSWSGFGESVVEHSVGYDNRNSWNYWGRMNYDELARKTLSNGDPALNVRGYVCEWGSTSMALTSDDITLGTQKYTYSSSTSSYKPSVTVRFNAVNETLEKNNDYLLDYYRNSVPGVAKARITGRGRFTGVAEQPFYITPGNISNLSASASEEGAILLSWSGGDGNSGFEIQCSTDSTFPEDDQKTTSTITSAHSATVTPPQGSGPQYYVRVRAITNDSTDEGKKAWGSWTSTLMLPGPVELDYLEVGFGGNVTVHWKNDSATNALSGYQIQHRFAQTGEPMTTTVNGYSINLKKLTSLSYNDYEIRIRSYKGSGSSQLYSPWSEWAVCPVKEIKIINPAPGSKYGDSLGLAGEISFGARVQLTETGAVSISESGGTPKSLKDYGSFLIIDEFDGNHPQSVLQIQSIQLSALTIENADKINKNLFKPNTLYRISISDKYVEYMKDEIDAYPVPVYFTGIASNETTWQYRTTSLSYVSKTNPKGLQIPDSYYALFYGPQDFIDVLNLDDGTEGYCFGLCYAAAAYKNNYATISGITSGFSQLGEVPMKSKGLLTYVQKAQILQYLPTYQKSNNLKHLKYNDIYNMIRNRNDVILNVSSNESAHAIYPLGILSDDDDSASIAVYDCNGSGYDYEYNRKTYIGNLIFNKALFGNIIEHKYRKFNDGISYVLVDSTIDAIIGGESTGLELQNVRMLTADRELPTIDDMLNRITPTNGNGETADMDRRLYWYEGTSYHYSGDNDPASITLSDGTNKLYVNLAAGQSATLDIANNKVTIDSVSNGGKAGDYSVRFSHADDYETFHDTVISGTSGNSGTVLQKVTDQIEVQTDSGTNLTVSNEENGRSTGTSTVNLSQNQAVIRTDGGVASVFVDKDGDGNYTDREQPIVVPEPGNESPSNPGKTDGKPTSGTSGSGSQNQATTVVKGRTYVVGGQTYKVTKVAAGNNAGTVSFVKAKNAKSVTVPATVKLEDGMSYAVTQVGAKAFTAAKIRKVTVGANVKKLTSGAFTKSKATTLVLKTQKLKKAGVKGSLKGSKVTKVQVKVGAKKVNKKYVKSYKKIFTKKIAGKKVRVL